MWLSKVVLTMWKKFAVVKIKVTILLCKKSLSSLQVFCISSLFCRILLEKAKFKNINSSKLVFYK